MSESREAVLLALRLLSKPAKRASLFDDDGADQLRRAVLVRLVHRTDPNARVARGEERNAE